MSNIFIGCKTIGDLYEVFVHNPDLTFEITTDAELNRLADVFEANVSPADMVDTPLGETEFNHIRNFVITKVNGVIEDMDVDFRKIMEEEAMKDKTIKVTIDNAINNMKDAVSSAKVHIGDDKESFVNRCDDSINEIKNTMGPILSIIDDAIGCTALKEEICTIMFDNLNGAKSKSGFFRMAEKCREAINRKVKLLSSVDPDDKLGRVTALRMLIGEYDDGTKIIATRTIWEAFANAICWICKKVARKLRSWFGVDEEHNIFGSVGAAIAGIAAKIGNVVKNVAKIAGTIASYVASYAVAGVVKIVSLVITAIKFVVTKVKGWVLAAKDKFSKKDKVEDELLDEELEEEFEFFDDVE